MPRYQQLRRWEVSAGYRAGRWEAAGADRRGCAGREDTAAPGERRDPTRAHLMRAERRVDKTPRHQPPEARGVPWLRRAPQLSVIMLQPPTADTSSCRC